MNDSTKELNAFDFVDPVSTKKLDKDDIEPVYDAKPGFAKTNKKFQDSIFRDIFKYKDNFLKMYNAIHPSDTSVTVDDLEWITLDNVLTIGLYNDVSYLVRDTLMVFVEHQSTIDNNMPLRLLLYYADVIQKYLARNNISLHKKSPTIMIPNVEFYVVYSGKRPWDANVLHLSDAIIGYTGSLDLKVNIIHDGDYYGSILDEYYIFINKLKELLPKDVTDLQGRWNAVSEAIEFCLSKGVLVQYLNNRKQEVVNMLVKDITIEEYDEIRREEGREETLEEVATEMLKGGKLSIGDVAQYTKLSFEAVRELKENLERY